MVVPITSVLPHYYYRGFPAVTAVLAVPLTGSCRSGGGGVTSWEIREGSKQSSAELDIESEEE